MAKGRMTLGLVDLRQQSPSFRLSTTITLTPDGPGGVIIPPGVAHGFYFNESSTHIYSVDRYWDLDDELGCQWNDPGLGLNWPAQNPMLSERDQALPTLDELMQRIKNHTWRQ